MGSPFARSALDLRQRGYSPLPIGVAGECEWNPSGKEPGRLDLSRNGEPEWYRFKGWNAFCKRQAHPATIAYWSTWADAGVGIACGYGGLVAVDIDDDSLIEPLRKVLPEIVVGKRGRKGATYFFRSADSLPSKNYRTADKRGLLDLLAEGKQSVLPPSIHPDTGYPYLWTTLRTLLDTPLAELPEITGAHVAALEDVLRQFGWDAPDRAQTRGDGVQRPARSQGAASGDGAFDRAVTTARSHWLPSLDLHGLRRVSGGWRSVASFRHSGSGLPSHKRGLSLSIRDDGSIIDHGTGQGYNNVTLVAECLFNRDNAKAFAWLREQIGWSEPVAAPVAQATYPDNRVSLEEAVARVRELTGADLDAAIVNGIGLRNQKALNPPLIHPVHSVKVVRSEAGVGKSHAAITGSAKQAQRARHIVYVVPRLDLADQIAAGFASHDVKAEVYRGYEQPDPREPEHAMCRNVPAYTAARDLGVGIRESVCERRIDGETVRCPLASRCGMERQREARPQVWIVTAALLFFKRPDFIFPPDAIVIDESFIDNAIGDTVQINVSELLASKIEGCSETDQDAVTAYRTRLAAAIKANGNGPLSRAALIEAGIDAEDAYWVGWLEQRRITSSVLKPNMREGELRTVAKRHASANKLARDAETLWREISAFLEEWKIEAIIGDRSRSGRITVSGNAVSLTPLHTVHQSWDAPVLALDATAPPASLLRIAFDGFDDAGLQREVLEQPDVVAKWPDHVRVRQITGAPVSMSKLGLVEFSGSKPRNVDGVVRFIRLRAALAAPNQVGVVTYKGLLEQIGGRLPVNVVARHFGALAGMNDMQDVAGLIVIGRPAPRRFAVEAVASVLAGRPVAGGAGHFFDKRPGGIRIADGSIDATTMDYHPEPIAEALRWRITEGELIQAYGRLRPHRRAEPCWLDIVCDVPLPLPVREVVRWGDVAPGAEADMAVEGVVLSNSRDAMQAFGLSKHDAEKIGGCPDFSNKNPIRDSGATSPIRRFTYRKAGPGQKQNTGYYVPGVLSGGVAGLRTWLEARLGPLASLGVERVQDGATFAKIGRATEHRFKIKPAFSPVLESIATFFDDLGQPSE
ncbi:bifunctional DNA primase/polymerase [Afipia sp. DC4300-2b1]|uniref:bifunctional DNA primase/polymerase n=1 Tax=Afipia sp. DC4300-2b1 TaxID=2804672 RepID=UPI003CF0B82E